MDYRILEIIRLIEEKEPETMAPLSPELMQELIGEGYDRDEIDEALSWIEVHSATSDEDSRFEITGDFREIRLQDEAHRYLTTLLRDGLVDEEYVDELLNYCLVTSDTDVDLDGLVRRERLLRFGKARLAKEALAEFQAFSCRKDC